MPTAPPGLLSVAEAAKRTGYAEAYIWELARKGKLKSIQREPRARRWFRPEDLDEFVGIKPDEAAP